MHSMHLPTELLARIADFLDRPDLICFSKVNTQCHAVCYPHKYREISLPSHGYEQYLERVMPAARPASLLSIRFPTPDEMPMYCRAPIVPFNALSSFIEHTPNLTDFYWSFNELLPAAIMAQLEQIGCRLHLREFYPSFSGNEHGYLMLSSCLYSIKTSGYISVQTLLPAIARTPYLKELFIGPYALHIPELHFLRPFPPSRAQLTRLQLQCCGVMDLAKWIDYSTLQSLQLNRLTAAECISMAQCEFPSLRQLTISRCQDSFLETFVPKLSLNKLELGTVSEQVLGIILDSIGHELERLRCVNTFGDEQWLRRHISRCKRLRDLAIGIRRCQGTDNGIYKCIAHRGPLPDEMMLAYDTLRDLATDEQLVRSIYKTISAPCSLQLQKLTIRTHWPPLYFDDTTPSDLSLLTWAVTQHWQLTNTNANINTRPHTGPHPNGRDRSNPATSALLLTSTSLETIYRARRPSRSPRVTRTCPPQQVMWLVSSLNHLGLCSTTASRTAKLQCSRLFVPHCVLLRMAARCSLNYYTSTGACGLIHAEVGRVPQDKVAPAIMVRWHTSLLYTPADDISGHQRA
ncbi:hypothetical protein AMS68_003826 [Peltaster fructicola]|uniref:F-box domain-containing protein n=1 Tax=Peltaster fructicola TaxID=286661 RepID=A0A6H0XUK5_9PEZI|nr:hypothetical protein AMS68_003826 [Peltaster fructicola]